MVAAEAVTTGNVFTVTVTCAVEEHPDAVPVTVYVVVDPGVTETELPVSDPGIQLYVVAPDALSVVDAPAHKVEFTAVAVTVGVGVTVTLMVATEVQVPTVPVTVYVVFEVGETDTLVPVSEPGIQV